MYLWKNGIHIIDLNKTVSMLLDQAACKQERSVKILFLTQRNKLKSIVSEFIKSINIIYYRKMAQEGY